MLLSATKLVSIQEEEESGYSFKAIQDQEKNRQLQEERDRLRRLMMRIPAVVVLLSGPEHVIELANDACLKLVCGRDILGMPIRYAMPELAVQGVFEPLKEVVATGLPYVKKEVRVRLQSEADAASDRTFFDLVYQPVKEADGHVSGILVHGVDVTEQVRGRQSEARLRELNSMLELQVAERAAQLVLRNRELQQFASIASHDLQEPLRKMHTFADLLKEEYGGQLDKTGQAYLDRIQAAAVRMFDLLRDMRSYLSIDAHADPFTKVRVSDIVQEVVQDLDVMIAAAGAQVEVQGEVEVEADRTQLRQMLLHLLANAIKFKKPEVRPQVQIILSQDCEAGRRARCRIVVADNGIGFDGQYAERIFEPYQHLNGSNEYPGTGMGLAICRRIVERHGGMIRAESTPGVGSRFMVAMPLHRQA